jgi:alkaline phosphatase
MISVSDHETGGLALGRQLTEQYPVYAWYPEVLANATHSTAWLAKKISFSALPSQPISRQFIVDEILRDGLGIVDASDDEIDKLVSLGARQNVDYVLADMVNKTNFLASPLRTFLIVPFLVPHQALLLITSYVRFLEEPNSVGLLMATRVST